MNSAQKKLAGAALGITGLFSLQGCLQQEAQAADAPPTIDAKQEFQWMTDVPAKSEEYLEAHKDEPIITIGLYANEPDWGNGPEIAQNLERYMNAKLEHELGPIAENIEVKVFPQKVPEWLRKKAIENGEDVTLSRYGCKVYNHDTNSIADSGLYRNPNHLPTIKAWMQDCFDEFMEARPGPVEVAAADFN